MDATGTVSVDVDELENRNSLIYKAWRAAGSLRGLGEALICYQEGLKMDGEDVIALGYLIKGTAEQAEDALDKAFI